MLFTKEFQDTLNGYADLLRFCAIVDKGVVIGKGGELMMSFQFRGKDNESSSFEELESVSQRLNSALQRLGSGWMIHCNAFRMESSDYAAEGHFSDPVTRLLDEERRRQYHEEGRHFEGQCVFTFTYLPPLLMEAKAKNYLFEQSEDLKSKSGPVAMQQMEYFKRTVDDIVDELRIEMESMIKLEPVMMHNLPTNSQVMLDPQVGFMHWCATGIRQPVIVPQHRAPFGLDSIIGSQDFYGGLMPRVGKKFIKVISLEGMPEGTHAGVLHIMNTIPVEFRWSTRFIYVDKQEALSIMDKHRKKWRQAVRGFMDQFTNKTTGAINQDAAAMSADAEMAMAECNSDLVRFGYYTSCVVLYHEDPDFLQASADLVTKALRQKSFVVRDEDINAVEAFLGSLPGHGYENLRRPLLHTLNLADLFPTTAIWQGLEENPCSFIRDMYANPDVKVPPLFYAASTGSTPFRGSLHVNDVGHTLILGPTGAGKSSLLAFLMASHFRYPRARVVAFDKGYSAFVLNQACGGKHYDILGENSKLGFCPLANVDKLNERAWAESYLMTMLVLQKVTITQGIRQELRRALQVLAKAPKKQRTLTHFIGQVQDKVVRQALEFYTIGGGAGGILNEDEDTLSNSHFTVFEMEELMEQGDEHIVPVLMYLFRCIERQLDGSPVMVVLDEAWLMLEHPMFQEKLREWLKVLRKANAHVVFATQEISDVHNSSIRDTIYSACMTKILLPNKEAASENFIELYRNIGLNKRQIQLLSMAIPRKQYYYMSAYGRRLFDLGLGPVALSLVATAGIENTMMARALIKEHGKGWIRVWMKDRGVPESMLQVFDDYTANQARYNAERLVA